MKLDRPSNRWEAQKWESQRKIIITMLTYGAIGEKKGLGFNELYRKMKKLKIQISKPTLSANLKELERKGLIKHKRKGKQSKIYFISIDKSILKSEISQAQLLTTIIIQNWDIHQFIGALNILHLLSALEDFKLNLKYTLGKLSEDDYYLAKELMMTFYNAQLTLLFNEIKKRLQNGDKETETELIKELRDLEHAIIDIRKQIFQRVTEVTKQTIEKP